MDKQEEPNLNSTLIFVGTGSSTGIPRLPCLIDKKSNCPSCKDALLYGSKNRRRNPSLLIQYKGKNILIDCGKTFRESMITLLTTHHVPSKIDAVLITHAHSDAYLGLDDLREFSQKEKISVYLREQDVNQVKECFPYLFNTEKATGSGKTINNRRTRIYSFNSRTWPK